jgi:hypothetical protein
VPASLAAASACGLLALLLRLLLGFVLLLLPAAAGGVPGACAAVGLGVEVELLRLLLDVDGLCTIVVICGALGCRLCWYTPAQHNM